MRNTRMEGLMSPMLSHRPLGGFGIITVAIIIASIWVFLATDKRLLPLEPKMGNGLSKEDQQAFDSSTYHKLGLRQVIGIVAEYPHGLKLVKVAETNSSDGFCYYALACDAIVTNGAYVVLVNVVHDGSPGAEVSGHRKSSQLALPIR